MAQWSGQYSGNTHGTRVQDCEKQLGHAINVYREQDTASGRIKQGETVLRMADKLLSARIRLRKVNAPQKPGAVDRKLQQMVDGGVKAILQEFNFPDKLYGADADTSIQTNGHHGTEPASRD